ncbi:hypothetical protein EXN61_21770 [Agrobacterium tumefaciens]|uniref:Uncharacterized protein n=1 Tax=Agrobacterium tumefaciens TaxID=358 RepID=A0A546XRX2_AGRTU|nr:hypothetical protein [Agrobacterium tumefaciens]TRB03492.1 hypothetical protein EXN61_21770 [Agrobacterium tumefaciens]
MKKFALFDQNGFPTAFYSSEIHGDQIPEDATEITEGQWRNFIENPSRRKWVDGEVIETATDPIEIPEPVTVVYSVDLWSRMTDAEADQVGAKMEQQPFRIRKIFETANSYRSDHDLWPLLQQIATTLFGAERAGEILAPSVQ